MIGYKIDYQQLAVDETVVETVVECAINKKVNFSLKYNTY